MSKTITEWMEQIAEEADAKGFWDPQCKHESAAALFIGGALEQLFWCDVCGAWKINGAWQLPIKARERNKGEIYMLFVSEVAEAFEEFRAGHGINEVYYPSRRVGLDGNPIGGPFKPEGQPVEIADIVIRILDFCGHMRIDLEAVMEEKFAYNKTRSFRHGNKLA